MIHRTLKILALIGAVELLATPVGPARANDASHVTYADALRDLHEVLGREYPSFAIKEIDWDAVGNELLPKSARITNDADFGLLCLEMVARLEDSHAHLIARKAKIPRVEFPRWDPGLTCLIDDQGKAVVYCVEGNGPAGRAGIRPGMAIVSINGQPSNKAIKATMDRIRLYVGYSSDRYLRYHAVRWFVRRGRQGEPVMLVVEDPAGRGRELNLPATMNARYLPRLPVSSPGVADSGFVSWKMLEDDIGYIYVRRLKAGLEGELDKAIGALKDSKGLVVDVRGNSGGGFDAARAHRNFDPDDKAEPQRPRFAGPLALLIDARCISAGEGWASWFIARKRAKVFGEATAGASGRKKVYTLKNGLFAVRYPVKAYRGYLDRPIERRGLEPDVPVRQSATDLAQGLDTVLEAARRHLLKSN